MRQCTIHCHSHLKTILLQITNKSLHDHSTRHSDDIHILQCNTNVIPFCTKIFGANVWNTIATVIRSAPSLINFKKKFKSHHLQLNA